MSAVPHIAVVYVDNVGSDWLALYLNGEKVYEGHPPEADDALDALGIGYQLRTFPSHKLSNLSRMRGMPNRLDWVPG